MIIKFPVSAQCNPPSLDHSIAPIKDDLLLCDDSLLPSRRIIGDRGGPASMKENICQVAQHSLNSLSLTPSLLHQMSDIFVLKN